SRGHAPPALSFPDRGGFPGDRQGSRDLGLIGVESQGPSKETHDLGPVLETGLNECQDVQRAGVASRRLEWRQRRERAAAVVQAREKESEVPADLFAL